MTRRRPSTRAFAVAAVLVALLLAGVVSHYASSSPDGLNRVAQDKGFASQERDSATSGSPLAGYSADEVDDDRLSGGLAGVAGVGVVLLLAAGLTWALKRRTPETDQDETAAPGAGRRPQG